MLFSLRRGKKHETFIKLGAPGTKLQVKDSNPFPFLIIYDLCRQYLQSQELIGLRKLALHDRIKSPSCAKPHARDHLSKQEQLLLCFGSGGQSPTGMAEYGGRGHPGVTA